LRRLLTCLAAAFAASPAIAADATSLSITAAWSPAAADLRTDVPLYMTIANKATEADELLRIRCPVSLFSEKRTTDYGEGAPAPREIKAIPVAAGETLVLAPGKYHVMLLKTTQPLMEGQSFSCTVAFRKAGNQQVEVKVATADAQSAPP
jgi:copper(I)-binding protein